MQNLFKTIEITVDGTNNNFNENTDAIDVALMDLNFINSFANYFLVNNIVSSVRTIVKGDDSSG